MENEDNNHLHTFNHIFDCISENKYIIKTIIFIENDMYYIAHATKTADEYQVSTVVSRDVTMKTIKEINGIVLLIYERSEELSGKLINRSKIASCEIETGKYNYHIFLIYNYLEIYFLFIYVDLFFILCYVCFL